jgi:beta-galactosidase
MGYQWRDYKESTESAFYKKYNNRQPIISYNNDIAAGAPKSEPLLHAQKEFREDRLVEATCAYAKVIQNNGAEAIGYFAETFTSHDAIYGAGVVEKLQKCIDIAVIDFNFYDGYRLISDADILPCSPTTWAHLGTRDHGRRLWGALGSRKKRQNLPLIQRSIEQSLLQSQVIGYEIGGFEHQTDGKVLASLELNKINQIAASVKTKSQKRLRIGILGSTSNFHVWHGERSAGRNIHHDTLFAAYKILSNQPDMEVHLIGEKNLLN